jgi:hypothetical protein
VSSCSRIELPYVLLIIKFIHSFKILSNTNRATQRHFPEDLRLQQHDCGSFKSLAASLTLFHYFLHGIASFSTCRQPLQHPYSMSLYSRYDCVMLFMCSAIPANHMTLSCITPFASHVTLKLNIPVSRVHT